MSARSFVVFFVFWPLFSTGTADAKEPSCRALQQAALRHAEVAPERARSWMKRIRTAGLAPQFRVRIDRGLNGTQILKSGELDPYAAYARDLWRIQVEASWSFDRLVFDPDELRVSHEAMALAHRREELSAEVARLYYARKRLLGLVLRPPADGHDGPDAERNRQLDIDELTAILDGLTGGALTRDVSQDGKQRE